MRVVNLAEPTPPVALEVEAAPASELLMSVVAVGDALGGSKDAESYDLGRARLQSLGADLPSELVSSAGTITAGYGKITANLLGLVYESPAPRDVDAFLGHLRSMEAFELLLNLLGYHMAAHRGPTPAGVIRRAAEGDEAAQKQFLGDWHRRGPELVAGFEHLLSLDEEAVKRSVLGFLSRWNERVFARIEPEARAVLERDAAAKRRLAGSEPVNRMVEVATNGIQFAPQAGITRVVLFPTYVLRPWVLISEHDDLKIFCYPAADDSVELDESTPPPQLVKLYKALGDSSRLKLLRRLAAGPITLKEATDLLASAKSTAHHHLAILRQAGLLWARDDEDKTYTMRGDLIPRLGELLEGYLESPETPTEALPRSGETKR